jgi:hypothetical protein
MMVTEFKKNDLSEGIFKMNDTNQFSTKDLKATNFKIINKIGAIASFFAAMLFRRNLDAEWMLFRGMGIINIGPSVPPKTIAEWFELLQQNALLGLTLLNLFDLVNYILVGLIFLALIVALRKVNLSWSMLAAVIGLTGIIVYLADNQAFTMLSLSHQYSASITSEQRQLLLVAGQAVLTIHQNAGYAGAGIYLSYLFVSIAGLIISLVMLYSNTFNKRTAIIGILANGIGLSYYIALLFFPTLVFIPISISAVFLLVWYLLVGIRLWSLSSSRMAISKRGNDSNQLPNPL